MDSNRDVASSTSLVLGRPGCVDLAISLYIHVGRHACATGPAHQMTTPTGNVKRKSRDEERESTIAG